MATNNIAFARNLDGSPLKVNDIKVGLKVTFPAATGGVFSYKCVSVNSIEAVFDNCNKEWPTVQKKASRILQTFIISRYQLGS